MSPTSWKSRSVLIYVFFCLTACAVARTYETYPLKEQLQSELSKVSNERARIQVDYEDKKSVLKSIEKHAGPDEGDIVAKLENLEMQMASHKERIRRRSEDLVALSGQFSALSYNREVIKPNDKVYDQAAKIIENYEKEMEAINADFKSYSQASNQFAAIVNKENLFRSYDVEEIDRRIKEAISSINASFYKLKSALDRKVRNFEQIVEKPGRDADNIAALEETLKLMQSQVSLLSRTSQNLNELRRDFLNRFQERVTVKSTDKDYTTFLRLKSEYEAAVKRLDQVDKDFSDAASRFNRLAENS